MVRWTGECVDVFANKNRQLVGLTGFKGAVMERLTKLTFVMGFPDTLSPGHRLLLNIETLIMRDHIARTRILMMTGGQNQDVVVAVHSPRSGITLTPFFQCDLLQVQWQRSYNKGLLEMHGMLLPIQ